MKYEGPDDGYRLPHTSSFVLHTLRVVLVALLSVILAACAEAGDAFKSDGWVDAATGHKIVRLSRREGNNETFYFHQNPFTSGGDKMVFLGQADNIRSAFTVDLKTFEVRQITSGRPVAFETVAPKRRELFYLSGQTVCATHLDTGATREIAPVPEYYAHGRGFSVNADETLLLGCYAKGEQEFYAKPRDVWIREIFEAKLPNVLYTIDVASGKISEFHTENNWIGHTQFSPVDPVQAIFCHEGPERELDRIWAVRTEDGGATKVRGRTLSGEFVTHELWDPSGKSVWYDLQVPGWFSRHVPGVSAITEPAVYLARVGLDSTGEQRYRLKGFSESSWHYNIAPDGKTLCGDGDGRFFHLGRSSRWINLYTPEDGKMRVERLCTMASHSYKIAPNTHFTPDGRWVVFQSDASGSTQVYAAEVQHGAN